MKDVLLWMTPLALMAILCGCAPWGGILPPGEARIRLLGRWDASGAPDRLVAVNPGSAFEFAFEGAGCELHFDRSANRPPLPQLWVRFDGEWSKHVVDRDVLVLGPPSVDPDEPRPRHEVQVVLKSADEHQARWTPPLVASLTLTGIRLLEGGRWLRPPRARKLLLEAIGDSITEGVLALRRGKLEEWTEIADSRATYAWQTALALGAEPRIIGFGAQGLTRGGNGGVPPAGLAYPFVYDGVPASERPADIVVIHQGGNDAGAPSIEAGYRNLIGLVRRRNPTAAIFCVVPFGQTHARSVLRAVVDARAEGDERVFLVETKGWLDPKTDTTDGAHPNAQGHAKAAKALTAFIRDVLKM